ncbi:MAG: signal recognition particle-docking protein FtsY [Ktedonobacterales bacterium]|nr:signal recognition particle-docking protein FtsY [Ktedonobacterales bacterium]
MFKRFRKNLFGLPEEEEQEAPDAPETLSEALPSAPPDIRATTAKPPTAARDSAPAAPPPAPTTRPSTAAIAPPIQRNPAPPPGGVILPPASDAEAERDAEAVDQESDQPRSGRLRNPFRFSLGRTRQLFGHVNAALEEADEITDDLWDELEEAMITGDVGVQTTEKLMVTLRERVAAEQLERGAQLRDALKEEMELLLGEPEPLVFSETSPITVVLVVGVNGVGKTTSIAKLANLLKRQKHRVLLAAGDTFRAAATEQIKTWGERVGVPVISHQHGADPGAVVYDAMQAAQARAFDVLIVDTAGRLHTKFNLMEELKKIVKVLQKYDAEAPHEILLVIDATTGQNGFLQAKQFVRDAGVSGVILTKLDGTARGGIAFAIASELGLPIKYVGTGEQIQDMASFDALQFVDALFDEA